MGVNVNYAPVCDLATNPRNPAVGIRSFGDDPAAVGEMVAAIVRGLQSAGVAAGLKHFPGIGDVADDTHHRLAVLDADREQTRRLRARAVPGRDRGRGAGRDVGPSRGPAPDRRSGASLDALARESWTASCATARVRRRLDHRRAGHAGAAPGPEPDPRRPRRPPGGRRPPARCPGCGSAASGSRQVSPTRPRGGCSNRSGVQVGRPCRRPPGVARHLRAAGDRRRRFARNIAHLPASWPPGHMTLVRDDGGRLPLRLEPERADRGDHAAPDRPDASRHVIDRRARAWRPPCVAGTIGVDRVRRRPRPATSRDRGRGRDRAATVTSSWSGRSAALLEPAQAALVEALLAAGPPVVTVALRTPFDLAAYPASRTHISTYGILAPSLEALADALFGEAGLRRPAPGRHSRAPRDRHDSIQR